MEEKKITADLLKRLISDLSEEYWCAGWYRGIEYQLWNALVSKKKNHYNPEDLAQLKYLSKKCGGWIMWDERKNEASYVKLEKWLKIYAAHEKEMKNAKNSEQKLVKNRKSPWELGKDLFGRHGS